MNEEEWLSQDADVGAMLTCTDNGRRVSDRKMLLAGCAFCWRLRQMTHAATKAIESIERRVDKDAESRYDMDEVEFDFNDVNEQDDSFNPGSLPVVSLIAAYDGDGRTVWNPGTSVRDGIVKVSFEVRRDIEINWTRSSEAAKARKGTRLPDALEQERLIQLNLLRDIFGNPFRPVTLDPRWLTTAVVDIAQVIYSERDFNRMPILADALMDAGCVSDEIIRHCQEPGLHVRGCWAIDLLLGKS